MDKTTCEKAMAPDDVFECAEMLEFVANWLRDQPLLTQEAMDAFCAPGHYDVAELRDKLLSFSPQLMGDEAMSARAPGLSADIAQGSATSVRDDSATITCPICGERFEPEAKKRFCGTPCRQAAWRRRNAAPVEPVVAKPDTVYACPICDGRFIGVQRCDECNAWCRRLGPGGTCPNCDEPVALSDLLTPEQLRPRDAKRAGRRR
jgi:hypothetical protein